MLKRILSQNKDVQLIQDNVDTALTPLQNSLFQSGNLLSSINLVAAQDNLIQHKLGHSLQIWILCGQDSNSTVWSPVSSSLGGLSSNAQFINLWCSSNCTVSLWVS